MNDVGDVGPIATTLLLATPFPLMMAVKIKVHIKSLKKKLKFFERKTANRGKRLQKAKKILIRLRKKSADFNKRFGEEFST